MDAFRHESIADASLGRANPRGAAIGSAESTDLARYWFADIGAVLHQVDAHTRPRSRNLDHFIAPLIVTARSIPILHEKVGIRRWGAIAAGLAGMVIIVRPGAHGIHPASILPVIGALGSAVAVIITRRMAGRDSVVTTTVWTALVGFAVLSLMVAFDFEPLTPQQLALGAYVGIASTAGQWLMTLSFGFADASLLAPIAYTQILWSTLLGAVVFGNLPSVQTCAGGAVIVVGGIYTAHRERMERTRG
jgi:drug/metabolite transporter (DMT)-like permease